MPRFNRPGIRLKRKGVSALSDAELLAIILGRGNKEENAIDLSNRVLKSNNFNKLADLSLNELEKEFKNEVKAMKIHSMFEVFRRTNRLMKHGFKQKIETAQDVFNHFVDEFQNKKNEYLYALFLDTKNKIIEKKEISKGILNASLIHPREVFKPAIQTSSNSVILVHNHTSGDSKPSEEDEEVSKMLYNAGDLLGIKVLDHVIIGNNSFVWN